MAGAGYKLFQTGDVLTAAQVNTYLNEQTVMVFANAAARTSALTSVLAEGMVSYLQDTNAVEVYNGSAWVGVSGAGDVTEVQAGTGISVASGTGPIPVVTNTMATAVDAKGDLIVGTGADTFARLAVGTNGYTLVADSAETTGLKWAAPAAGGAYTSLATGTLSGATTTISGISGSYKDLYLVIVNPSVSVDSGSIGVRINSDTNSNRHKVFNYSALTAESTFDSTRWSITDGMDDTVAQGIIALRIYDYANTTTWKIGEWCSVVNDDAVTTSVSKSTGFGVYNQTGAITSLQFFEVVGGNLDAGNYVLYGVK